MKNGEVRRANRKDGALAEQKKSSLQLPRSAELSTLQQEPIRAVITQLTSSQKLQISLLLLPTQPPPPVTLSSSLQSCPSISVSYREVRSHLETPLGQVVVNHLSSLIIYERRQTLTPAAHQTARVSPGPAHSSTRRLPCSVPPRHFQLQAKENDW